MAQITAFPDPIGELCLAWFTSAYVGLRWPTGVGTVCQRQVCLAVPMPRLESSLSMKASLSIDRLVNLSLSLQYMWDTIYGLLISSCHLGCMNKSLFKQGTRMIKSNSRRHLASQQTSDSNY